MLIQWLTYTVEVSLFTGLTALFYTYVYHKMSYFVWNRFFLVLMSMISLIVPLIQLPVSIDLNTVSLQEIISNSQGGFFFVKTEQTPWFSLNTLILGLFIFYFSGVIRYLYVFSKNLIILNNLKTTRSKQKNSKIRIHTIEAKQTIFSFFNHIFVTASFYRLAENEQKQILEHEKIHASQKHSLDVLFFEILEILFWFNPFQKQLTKAAKENHEFIVDEEIKKTHNEHDYAHLMLKMAQNQSNKLASSFSKNSIKNRILMLIHADTEQIRKIRFKLSIPVVIIGISAFLFLTSLTNSVLINNNSKSNFSKPVNEKAVLLSDFFIRKRVINPTKKNSKSVEYLLISHPKYSYQLESNSPVFSCANGQVENVESIDDWGVESFTITIRHDEFLESIYEGLGKTIVEEKQFVEKGNTIGFSGDKRFLPTVDFQLLINNKPVNPKDFF